MFSEMICSQKRLPECFLNDLWDTVGLSIQVLRSGTCHLERFPVICIATCAATHQRTTHHC